MCVQRTGQAGIIVTNIDEDGIAHYDTERVSLTPDEHELDYKLAYNMPLDRSSSLSVQAAYRKDAFLCRPGIVYSYAYAQDRHCSN